MTAIILFTLAGFFKAVSDTLVHHFYSSVFRRWEASPFWNPLHVRNDAVKRIFNLPIDGWHISNSLMIFCFTGAAVFNDLNWHWWWQVSVLGKSFLIVFGLFYSKIFRRK